jgi:type II secretory pathway component PulJ
MPYFLPRNRTNTKLAKRAFTILELLVSCAILGIVMFVMLAAVDTGMRLWKTTEEKIQIDREGRIALSQISQDLKNMINPSSPKPIFIMQPKDGETFMKFLVLKPEDYQDNTMTPPENVGDVCYVEYKLQDKKIYRGFVDSKETFEKLKSGNFPTVKEGNQELLAVNVETVTVETQDIDGVKQELYTDKTRSLFCYVKTIAPNSLVRDEQGNLVEKFQHFTVLAAIPPPKPPTE